MTTSIICCFCPFSRSPHYVCYLIIYKHGLLLKTQPPLCSNLILLGCNTNDASNVWNLWSVARQNGGQTLAGKLATSSDDFASVGAELEAWFTSFPHYSSTVTSSGQLNWVFFQQEKQVCSMLERNIIAAYKDGLQCATFHLISEPYVLPLWKSSHLK